MHKNYFISILLTFLISQCTSPGTEQTQTTAPPDRKPNIIFILADDLGYGDLGCFGQEQIQTPRLDQMAAEGLRFTQHYAGSTVCAPSRSVLMTGLHTGHTPVRGNAGPDIQTLQANDVTIAEALKQAGYTTGLMGKWGLGDEGNTGHPNDQGFDEFFGYLNQVHAHNYYPEFLWHNKEKVELQNVVEPAPQSYGGFTGGVATERVDYSHDLVAEEALQFIENHQDTSFFLYLALTIPHANNESRHSEEHGLEVPDYGIYADKDWPEVEKGFAAMVMRMDKDVGRVLDQLKELGIAENTIVIFSSDNGPHREGDHDPNFFNDNGPLRGTKRDLYEGGIRVPAIAWWPGIIAAGSETDYVSAFWDFFPTACEIAGTGIPEHVDGISMLPSLRGQEQPTHEYLYWEFLEQGGKQAVRMGNWKGVKLDVKENPDAPIELYNLAEDLEETTNMADQYPDIVAQMQKIMQEAHTPDEDWPLLPGEITIDQ